MSIRHNHDFTVLTLFIVLLALMVIGCSDKSTEPATVGVTIEVPGDYETIQGAINAAKDWDRILIADGVYYERINFLGKTLMVVSEYYLDRDPSHIENTIIDADTNVLGTSDTGSVVVFVNGEDQNSLLIGLTLRNGSGTVVTNSRGTSRRGGGIYCDSTSPTVTHCLIEHNSARLGGGFHGNNGAAHFEACTFRRNNGTALCAFGSSVSLDIYRSEILNNVDNQYSHPAVYMVSGDRGGTLRMTDCLIAGHNHGSAVFLQGIDAHIDSCDFYDNSNENAGPALCVGSGCRASITNCSFNFNSGFVGSALGIGKSPATVTDCEFIGNVSQFDGVVNIGGDSLSMNGCIMKDNICEDGAVSGGYHATIDLTRCLLAGNSPYAVSQEFSGAFNATRCTFFGNGGALASIDDEEKTIAFDDCVIANNQAPVDVGVFSCCNIYGNSGGDWVGEIADQLGVNGNMSLDPMFCDTLGGDFRLQPGSPCAPSNNECGTQIGAFGVGCQ